MPVAEGLERTYRIERVSASTSPRLFQQLAKLHIDSIHGGIMEALGPNFVASLYRQLGKRCDVLMFTALQEARVIGFVAGSSNVRCSLRNLGIAGFSALAISACGSAWRPSLVWKVLRAAGYFLRQPDGRTAEPLEDGASDPTRAELLAIAVAEEARGLGVGSALVTALEQQFQNSASAGEYFVSTNREEIGSNAFYRASGFTLVGQKRHHDLMLNIYKKKLAEC